MRLMKFNFICPVCDKLYFTYIEQKHYQEMFNGIAIEDNFKGYPDYYQLILKTSICQNCQNIDKEYVCAEVDSDKEEDLYIVIEQLEYAACRNI